jgi:hypothetical protein
VTLIVQREVHGPATHVLAVGVGSYPHLMDGAGPLLSGGMAELGQLGQLASSAPSTWAFTSWIRDEFSSATSPLGTVELLLSPGELYEEPDLSDLHVEPARFDNLQTAFDSWHERCSDHKGNTAIFYFCGHGLRSGSSTVLLLEDFGSSRSNPFRQAIDIEQTQLGMESWAVSRWFFIDMHRTLARQIFAAASTAPALVVASVESPRSAFPAATFYGAIPGSTRSAAPDKVTYFTQSLIDGLRGRAAIRDGDRWVVNSSSLTAAIQSDLTQLTGGAASLDGFEVRISGTPDSVINEFTKQPLLKPLGEERLAEALARAKVSIHRPRYPGYVSDLKSGQELLGRSEDIQAMAMLLTAKSTEPPLSVGLFGDWGSGKTFFIDRLRTTIDAIADASRTASGNAGLTEMCAEVRQVVFNAWHYVDANLWASLVVAIFQELAAPQRHESDADAERRWKEQRDVLVRKLESTRGQLIEAEANHEAAKLEHQRVTAALDNLRAQHEKDRNLLQDLVPVARLVLEQQNVATKVEAATAELGLSAPLGLEQLRQFSSDAWFGWQRLGRIWRLLNPGSQRGLRTWLWISVAVAAVLAVVLPFVLQAVAPGVVQAFAGIIGMVAPLVTIGGTVLARLNKALKVVEDAAETAAEAERQQQEKRSREEKAILADLERIDAQQAALAQEALRAQQRVDEAAARLEDVAAGRQLARFIQERSASSDYREQLGIIAMIRRDFDHLVKLIEQSQREERKGQQTTLPPVERIILYVDDLDRCPPSRVVDVLQAIHLLLGLRLFIVVVAVDPRWLLRSIAYQFEAVLGARGTGIEGAEEDAAHWAATPMNYLEKIFQIPYTLAPMDPQGYARLVAELLPEEEPGDQSGRPESSTVEHREGTVPAGRSDGGQAGAAAETTNGRDIARPDEESRSSESGKPPPVGVAVDLTPNALFLDIAERQFADHLAPLIPTPRAAKRLANLYRFIRASLSEDQLDTLVPTHSYQAILVLLAILVGFPGRAAKTFQAILDRKDGDSWWELVRGLKPQPGKQPPQLGQTPVEADSHRFHSLIADDMPTVEVLAWQRLASALMKLEPQFQLTDQLMPFKVWIPRVARFSFHTGRLVTADYLPEPPTAPPSPQN